MKRLLCLFLLLIACLCVGVAPAAAQNNSGLTSERASREVEAGLEAQLLKLSFNDMPAFKNGGFVLGYRDAIYQIEGDAGVARFDELSQQFQILYDPARKWEAGRLPSEVIKLGDLMYTGAGLEYLTMDTIAALTGIDIENFQLSDVPFLRDRTLSDLVGDIPFVGDYPLADLPNLAKQIGEFDLNKTLSQVLKENSSIGQLPVTGDILGGLQVNDFPGFGATQLADVSGIGNEAVANIPGLSAVPLGDLPGLATVGGLIPFAKQDISFGKKEYSGDLPTPKPVSGGTDGGKRWKAIACEGGCPHIELTDSDISPARGAWAGANWMTREHRVKDGYGLLGSIFGEAGAYRLPFGPVFALQVANTDEKTGAADWGIAFRVCSKGLFFDLGCTAYFLEVDLPITTHEKDTILTGIKDGKGGATQPINPPEGWEDLRPATPSELESLLGTAIGGSLCGEGPGGISYGALGEAYGAIEGSYTSVGKWVNLGGRERGYGLGKYQYMSYREDVRAAILKQPGGKELLAAADANSGGPTAAQIARSFPPNVQDSIFVNDQEKLIKKAMANGYEGDRLLEVLGQMHFYGPALIEHGVVDSTTISDRHGRLSLKDYGEEFRDNYKKALEGSESECKSTGDYINPIKGARYRPHSGFGMRFHPKLGINRLHGGVDLGGQRNEIIVASDGGVVSFAAWNSGGFGNLVVITHDNGDETKYAHLNGFLVSQGARVKQGDPIGKLGTTGLSTGDHLHFELHRSGQRVDPAKHVDFSKGV